MIRDPGGRGPYLLRAGWDRGMPAVGTFFRWSDPVLAERQAKAGWDFIVIDLQHGAVTVGSLVSVIMAVELGGSIPLVRVPANDPAIIMRALDCGAAGVVIPMVDDAKDAAAAAAACQYPPAGMRSFGQLRGNTYGGTDGANAHVVCIPMVETRRGLDNAAAIAATPGVDAIFVGPVDLALGVGLPATTAPDDPQVMSLFDRIAESCAGSCVAGRFVLSRPGRIEETVREAVAGGWRMIAVQPETDIDGMRRATEI